MCCIQLAHAAMEVAGFVGVNLTPSAGNRLTNMFALIKVPKVVGTFVPDIELYSDHQ